MPIYNEEANIEAVVTEWVQELNRLGISLAFPAVNDGSKDGTGAVLQRLAERYPGSVMPVEKRNAGHGRACRTGIEPILYGLNDCVEARSGIDSNKANVRRVTCV